MWLKAVEIGTVERGNISFTLVFWLNENNVKLFITNFWLMLKENKTCFTIYTVLITPSKIAHCMIICDLNLYRFMIFQMLSTTGSKIDLFHTFIQNLNLNYMCMHMYVHVIYIVSKNPVINFISR